ncbi:MAG TPA: hypothetical protein VFS21_21165 [Roseiflexaceae bacterium]|nr:hypothetical protein [Roseiflexaceae bacterium]
MGRKSRAEVRRAEILAAFERCIVRWGFDVPLEQIADEAGVRRSLIRHYLGNRDELVDQLIAQIAQEYPQRAADFFSRMLERGADGLLDALFPLGAPDDSSEGFVPSWDAAINALLGTAQGHYPQAKQRLAQMMEQIVEQTAGLLRQHFPRAGSGACYEAAYGLLCLVQSHDMLLSLGMNPRHTVLARASAARLLADLGERSASPQPG